MQTVLARVVGRTVNIRIVVICCHKLSRRAIADLIENRLSAIPSSFALALTAKIHPQALLQFGALELW